MAHICVGDVRGTAQKVENGLCDGGRQRITGVDHPRVEYPQRRHALVIRDRVGLDSATALPSRRDPRRVGTGIRLYAPACRDPIEGLEMERGVGVARLAYPVGVVPAARNAVGEDEDAMGCHLFEEHFEAEAVVGAAGLAPDYDGELQIRWRVDWGEDRVVTEGRVRCPGLGESR